MSRVDDSGDETLEDLSDSSLRDFIRMKEESGATGATDKDLDAASKEQTRRMPEETVRAVRRDRKEKGKPCTKLDNEARRRGMEIDDDDDEEEDYDGPGTNAYDQPWND